MKKLITGIIVLIVGSNLVISQETSSTTKEKDVPVIAPFESGMLIDNQTCVVPSAKTLEFLIQHRFGTVDKKWENVFGIYSSANIRLGLNYSILNNLMVGYGLTRNKMNHDVQLKYNVLQQTRKNTIPVAVTLYGNMAVDGRNEDAFKGTGDDGRYEFTDRMAYFSQLIVGRKFCDWFTMQASASFTHYNKVAAGLDHDKIGVGVSGRMKFSPQSSIMFQFDAPLKLKEITEQHSFINPPKPNVALGYEVSTGTHVFQIFISNTNGILPQENYMYNLNEWQQISNWMFGFTMTRLWGF